MGPANCDHDVERVVEDHGPTATWECDGCGARLERPKLHQGHQRETVGWWWVRGHHPEPAPLRLTFKTSVALLASTVYRFSEARGRPS